jgi:hypothetical protein
LVVPALLDWPLLLPVLWVEEPEPELQLPDSPFLCFLCFLPLVSLVWPLVSPEVPLCPLMLPVPADVWEPMLPDEVWPLWLPILPELPLELWPAPAPEPVCANVIAEARANSDRVDRTFFITLFSFGFD